MEPFALTNELKAEAQRIGFTAVGVCPAASPPGLAQFQQWLDAGYAGQMSYLPDRAEAYRHPRSVMEGVKSIVMLAMNYYTHQRQPSTAGTALVSRYAWGTRDYHDVMHERLKSLIDTLHQWAPKCRARGVVDTAPLLERELAQQAGLGWVGKNTLLLSRTAGSWFFLAALLTDLELDYDQPFVADHCGSCRACLDACPTDAFPQAYVLDATRCISYLTIELRDMPAASLRTGISDWLFGCDICQEVCPWNHRAPTTMEQGFQPAASMNPADPCDLFGLDEKSFRDHFRSTPLWRSKRRGLLRNAAIVLGNHPTAKGLAALTVGINDTEPLVRAASAWALGKFEQEAARQALTNRLTQEHDKLVREEINAGLREPRH